MKTCINDACKVELEDYVTRCPDCGWLQKRINPKKNVVEKTSTQEAVRKRHGFITFWLWLLIIGNSLLAIILFSSILMIKRNFPSDTFILLIVSAALCLINVVGFILLLLWQRIGFIIIAVITVFGSIFAYTTAQTFPAGLIGLIILWFVLNIKEDGIPYWDAME